MLMLVRQTRHRAKHMQFSMGIRNYSGLLGRRLRRLTGVVLVTAIASLPLASSLSAKNAIREVNKEAQEQYERLFVLANTEFTLLHEIAHVIIWEKNPPIFGREEDAADTIAVMAQMMLPADPKAGGEIRKLQAVADGWKLEWQLVQEDDLENAYWDLHSLEIQRYYNIACLVYGADPENRTDIVTAAQLPTDRAEWCHEEYALAKRAMDWLMTKLTDSPVGAFTSQHANVTVSYARNTTLEGEKLDTWLRESGIAERLAEALMRRFDLPRDIEISFESCPFPNAAWDVKTAKIQFCHALLNRFLYLARELSRERNESADNSVWKAAAHTTTSGKPGNSSTINARSPR